MITPKNGFHVRKVTFQTNSFKLSFGTRFWQDTSRIRFNEHEAKLFSTAMIDMIERSYEYSDNGIVFGKWTNQLCGLIRTAIKSRFSYFLFRKARMLK